MAAKYCKRCGRMLKPGAKFCAECGISIPDTTHTSILDTTQLAGTQLLRTILLGVLFYGSNLLFLYGPISAFTVNYVGISGLAALSYLRKVALIFSLAPYLCSTTFILLISKHLSEGSKADRFFRLGFITVASISIISFILGLLIRPDIYPEYFLSALIAMRSWLITMPLHSISNYLLILMYLLYKPLRAVLYAIARLLLFYVFYFVSIALFHTGFSSYLIGSFVSGIVVLILSIIPFAKKLTCLNLIKRRSHYYV